MKLYLYIFLFFLVTLNSYAAPESVKGRSYQAGLEELKNNRYEEASNIFREILSEPSLKSIYPEALFALAKSELALGNYRNASNLVDRFIHSFPDNDKYQEAVYMRGRLLHLDEESEKAIVALEEFISNYPDSVLVQPTTGSERLWWNWGIWKKRILFLP